ncbi:flavin-dependent oxidoreductase [Streptomyces sp. NPDC001514]
MADGRDSEIVVAGAGIGGLVTALSLHAAGYTRIRVLEAAAEIRPLGVGLNILPHAIGELTDLGLYERLAERAVQTADFFLYHRTGGLIWREPRGLAAGYSWPQLSIHRGHLLQTLLDAVRERLGPRAVLTDARVTGCDQQPGGRVRVTVEHRAAGTHSETTADLLVGADGLHSAVRAALHPHEGAPCTNGMIMWRGTTWAPPYLGGRSMVVLGDDRHKLVIYPIVPAGATESRTLVNWVTGLPRTALTGSATDPATRTEEVLRHYGDWNVPWADIPYLIENAAQILEYPMQDRDPLESWVHGRVVLLGDAAHPMYPVGSNGATQAVLDGRALAWHLDAHHHDIDRGLAEFQAERRPALTAIQAANRAMGPERAIDVVHRRAPGGFTDIHEVMAPEELAEISRTYNATALLENAVRPDGTARYGLGRHEHEPVTK